jgi:hypothetical protein
MVAAEMSEGRTIPRLDSRGLDFSNLTSISEEEIQAFRQSYLTEDGNRQSGFDFLIDNNPAALKTYRYFVTSIQAPFRDPRYQAAIFGGIAQYGLMDFEEGIRYSISPALRAGFTRDQIGEGLALSFMVGGTRTLVTVARALKDYDWPAKAEDALPWPEGWVADPAAFASGVDFGTVDVLPGEVEKIIQWYERTINWVPTWVRYFARHNPAALKGWRYRYENALVTLPRQVLPLSFLFAGAALEHKELTKENFLLARAWGVPVEQILQTIEIATVYGTEKISSAYAAIGDLLDDEA